MFVYFRPPTSSSFGPAHLWPLLMISLFRPDRDAHTTIADDCSGILPAAALPHPLDSLVRDLETMIDAIRAKTGKNLCPIDRPQPLMFPTATIPGGYRPPMHDLDATAMSRRLSNRHRPISIAGNTDVARDIPYWLSRVAKHLAIDSWCMIAYFSDLRADTIWHDRPEMPFAVRHYIRPEIRIRCAAPGPTVEFRQSDPSDCQALCWQRWALHSKLGFAMVAILPFGIHVRRRYIYEEE